MNEQSKLKKILDKFFSIIELKSLKGLTIVLAVVCVIMLIALGYAFQKKKEPEVISKYNGIKTQADEPMPSQTPVTNIFVHVKGAVKTPGLYKLERDCRIVDAINAAGGVTNNAAVDRVNLAEKLSDESELYIPSKTEPKITPSKATSSKTKKVSSNEAKIKVVNINTASAIELVTLPGIGETYANKIISFRALNGDFRRIEDIMKVKGISKGRFDGIKDYISI